MHLWAGLSSTRTVQNYTAQLVKTEYIAVKKDEKTGRNIYYLLLSPRLLALLGKLGIPCNTTPRGAPEIPQGRACALRDMTKARNPVSECARTDLLIEARRLATNVDAIIIPHSCVHERKGAYHE